MNYGESKDENCEEEGQWDQDPLENGEEDGRGDQDHRQGQGGRLRATDWEGRRRWRVGLAFDQCTASAWG